jgi:hypothetical protein
VRLFAYPAEVKNKAFVAWKGTTLSETDTVHRLMIETKGKEDRKNGKLFSKRLGQYDSAGTTDTPSWPDTMSYLYTGKNNCFSCNKRESQKRRGRG